MQITDDNSNFYIALLKIYDFGRDNYRDVISDLFLRNPKSAIRNLQLYLQKVY